MISAISKDDPQGHNAIEQVGDKHKVTAHAHVHVQQPQQVGTQDENVTLSHRARAEQLKHQGCSIREIATIMSMDAKTVIDYMDNI